MKEILFSVDFLLCLAISILGILITIEMRKQSRFGFLSSLLFSIVFFSAYGLYGIWGQQFLKYVVAPVENPDLMKKLSGFLSLLGIPFLVTAWFMIIKFSTDIRFKTWNNFMVPAFFFINTGCIILSHIFFRSFSERSVVTDSSRIFFTAFNLFYFFLAGLLLILSRSSRDRYAESKRLPLLGGFLAGSGLMTSIPILFSGNHWAADLFITLLFFLGISLPAIFLRFVPLKPLVSAGDYGPAMNFPVFESFCKRYEISPREAEIIRELCRGFSNQEIADRLFITRQTVKDHLYRIFIKTDVNSRIQLVNLVRGGNPE